MREFEVNVFRDTVHKYSTTYAKETKELKTVNTKVYTEQPLSITPIVNSDMCIAVVSDGTVNAGKGLVDKFGTKTAILNFADAIEPGGLVLYGETTQEENICRCSNLYASLTTDIAYGGYYNYNSSLGSSVYSDRVIYSKNVLFFKDDTSYTDVKPYKMDVITCPAPLGRRFVDEIEEHDILYKRIVHILEVAIDNDVKNLVLGAWGCGAFGQNPKIVSKCFKEALAQYNCFDRVVFAIRSCRADMPKAYNNYDVFCDTLR